MNLLVILLRILHIVAGVLWAGGALHYFLFIEPRVDQLGHLAQEIQGNGGSASREQAAVLNRTQKQLELLGKADFLLILLALFAMSTARYWSF